MTDGREDDPAGSCRRLLESCSTTEEQETVMSKEVLVVTGAGGIGQAIARRLGPGKSVLLADFNEQTLQSAAKALEGAGLDVTTRIVDVSSRESVGALAQAAEGLGSVVQVAHTAGQSPTMAPPEAILTVDLLGTALLLEEMGNVIADGGAGVVISSMAGHRLRALEPEQDDALRNTPTDARPAGWEPPMRSPPSPPSCSEEKRASSPAATCAWTAAPSPPCTVAAGRLHASLERPTRWSTSDDL
jgi:NAD(P)-dependent dehydrogenase (short-subunit alcohol dehydrogenase family)